jgi:hypothetical protein
LHRYRGVIGIKIAFESMNAVMNHSAATQPEILVAGSVGYRGANRGECGLRLYQALDPEPVFISVLLSVHLNSAASTEFRSLNHKSLGAGP